jgi:hypothetical protein
MPNFPFVGKKACEMFEFAVRFETFSRKSPMKWLAFPKEAKVKCRITFFYLSLIRTFNFNKKIASNSCKLKSYLSSKVSFFTVFTISFINSQK